LLAGGFILGVGAIAGPPVGADEGVGFTTPDGVTIEEGGENCKGIMPTPGSQNTRKFLTSDSVLIEGGVAGYVVTFPINPKHADTFEVVDCVLLMGEGTKLKDYEAVVAQATFENVSNDEDFEFSFALPASLENGDRVCNVAKTTEKPSGSPKSNRKAGAACFVVGGQARVEKHDATNGELLDGATFSIHDCVNPSSDPSHNPIIVSLEDADGNALAGAPVAGSDGLVSGSVVAAAIGFNGPAGATCQVTETEAPEGYLLPENATVTVAMGGNTQVLSVFNDLPVSPTTTEAPTTTVEVPTTLGSSVGGTQETAKVLGLQLARTGASDLTELLLWAATVLILVGGLILLGGKVREERVT
jgi:hypothetical protein